MSTFKIAVTAVFAVSIVFGVAMFALSKGSDTELRANLVVWGTVPADTFKAAYEASSIKSNKNVTVKYVEKNVSTFDTEFIEALADGVGPDMVVLREDFLHKHRNRFFTIPYASFTERAFKDRFIEQGEMFLTPEGVSAFPFIVDPLVLYWNRDMFSNNAIVQPPLYWDELNGLVTKLTKKDAGGSILQSTIALGEYRNITNAKEIISMLLFQAGTPITGRSSSGLISVLNEGFGYPVMPSQSAINFYTQFSNPTSPAYSWNRSLPTSLNMFLAGNSAMYLGFASEIQGIQQRNSNLNFDVTLVPQIRNAPKKVVFGHMYALAVVKQSKQITATFTLLAALTEPASMKALEPVTNLPPVRRDMLAQKPTDAFREVFYTSAVISKSWMDPDPTLTNISFRDLIESVTSGRARLTEALGRLSEELNIQLK